MYLKHLTFISIVLVLIGIGGQIFAQLPPTPQLSTIQTAEPLGKGGSTTIFSMFKYSKVDLAPEHTQNVDIGEFEESHYVTLETETFLIPVRFIYGVGEHLDFTLGATFSTGGVRKVILDYYNTGDTLTGAKRVYDQPLYDGLIGLKYNIKPDRNDGLPSISVGGDVQFGFTADDRLNADGEFLDHSPADGFPFFGVNTYIAGTQRVGSLFKLHGGIGAFLLSKALGTGDSFTLNWQAGGEMAVGDNMWLVADFTRELPYAGINLANMIGVSFRYEISNTLAFQVGYNTLPGFQFNLILGGDKAQALEGEDILF